MTAQHVAWLLLGVASGVASGYPWGRVQLRRAKFREFAPRLREALRRTSNRAYEDGWCDAMDHWGISDPRDRKAVMPLAAPESEGSRALVNVPRPAGAVDPELGPGHPDRATDVACPQCGAPVGRSCGPGVFCHAVRVNVWHDSLVPGPTIAIELAPETLAKDVPRARMGGRPVTPEQPGPGHPPWPPVHAAEKSGSLEAYAQGPGRPWDDLADEIAAEAEAHLARHTETHDEWIARMDYEHALWCAETGLVNEWAAA